MHHLEYLPNVLQEELAMAIKIEIPVSGDSRVKALPVRFPDKCVFCGGSVHGMFPRKLEQTVKERNELKKHSLVPVDIPYCAKHLEAIQASEAREDDAFGLAMTITMAVLAIPLLLLLFRIVYGWIYEAAGKYLGILGPVASGFGTLVLIGFADFALGAFAGIIIAAIARAIMRPPYGLKTFSALGAIHFKFSNDEIGEEFRLVNAELGAMEYSFVKTLKGE
jgi:hypothetical protein